MKVKVPAKEIEVCDLCQAAGRLLTECIVCKKDHCLLCEAIVPGCIHNPEICKECGQNEHVIAVIDRFADILQKLFKQRDTAMRRAGKRKSKATGNTR